MSMEPKFEQGGVRLYLGDCLETLKALPDECVQCCVTSPPYWGLRDYGCDGQLGLEETPAEYIAKMVAVFREVRRVLRKDGTCWCNMGDSYASGQGGRQSEVGELPQSSRFDRPHPHARPELANAPAGWAERAVTRRTYPAASTRLKPKDLCGIPWMLAFALRDDGWWLRQDIIWNKPNPMPESVTDRCTKAHEYVFLLTKAPRYFYDAEAVREEGTNRPCGNNGATKNGREYEAGEERMRTSANLHKIEAAESRNRRSVWTISTQAFSEAHFATFPEKLVEPCILAGTSEKGCCPECGSPWRRVVEKARSFQSGSGRSGNMPEGKNGTHLQGGGETLDIRRGPCVQSTTTGWEPTCKCGHANTVPCVVLDPFAGSGTTLAVAYSHYRHAIGIELNPEYLEIAKRRIGAVQEENALLDAAG